MQDDEKNEDDVKLENSKSVTLSVHTKLGNTKKSFLVNDLKKIKYFQNQLARWNKDNDMMVESKELEFDVNEVKILIEIKKNGQIPCNYNPKRFEYFCNAIDYFTENVECDIFEKYLNSCVPAISRKQLLYLKQLCSSYKTAGCVALCNVIDKFEKQYNHESSEHNKHILNGWKYVPSKLLICNGYVAASIFIQHFKICTRKKRYYDENYIRLLDDRKSGGDLSLIWKYIVNNKLWLFYPKIISTVVAFNSRAPSSMTGINPKVAETLSDICADTMNIICTENISTFKCQQIDEMIQKFCICVSLTKSDKDVVVYDFIIRVFFKFMELRKNSVDDVGYCCTEIGIIKLMVEYWDNIGRESRSEQKKFQKQLEVLKLNFKAKTICDLLRVVIEMDIIETLKISESWFPLLMNDQQKWIIAEVPNKVSRKNLKCLVITIIEYMSSSENESKPCAKAYADFVTQYM